LRAALIWQIKTTLAHGHGRAALLRRLLADQQVSPTGLAFAPMLIETAIGKGFQPCKRVCQLVRLFGFAEAIFALS
jgi:hypothetical protein